VGAMAFSVFFAHTGVSDANAWLAHNPDYVVNGVLGFIQFTRVSLVMPYVIALIVTGIIIPDYRAGIVRNMVMSGQPRFKIYMAKFIICTIVSLILFTLCASVFVAVISAIFGFNNDSSLFVFGLTWLHVLFQYTAFVAFVVLVADLTRSTAASISVSLGLTFVFNVIAEQAYTFCFETNEWMVNAALQFIGDLYVGNLVAMVANFEPARLDTVRYLATATVYLIVSLGAGLFLFKKRDIK
jgi:ABC-type transport system involved in multi-copper enzyme maturation permease subunit